MPLRLQAAINKAVGSPSGDIAQEGMPGIPIRTTAMLDKNETPRISKPVVPLASLGAFPEPHSEPCTPAGSPRRSHPGHDPSQKPTRITPRCNNNAAPSGSALKVDHRLSRERL